MMALGLIAIIISAFVIAMAHIGKIDRLSKRVMGLESSISRLMARLDDLASRQMPTTGQQSASATTARSASHNQPAPPSAPPPLPPVAPPEPVQPIREVQAAEARKTEWEARIGKRWLTWGGVLLLAVATGFLITYAYDRGWIGPWFQIGIGATVGCGLCVLGDWQVRVRNMRPLGQGYMALGLTLVYLTCFGAYAYFKPAVASQLTTLCFLAATAGVGILLSNRHRSMPICILAAIGGYLAPPLVSTGQPLPMNGLFAYTVLVNLGVIIISIIRVWPVVPLLAFGGTVVHFEGWHTRFYVPEQSAAAGMWAAIFHFVFLILPSLPLLRGRRENPWQWLLPTANAALGVYGTWMHLRDDHPLALMLTLLGMAVVHLAIGLKARALKESAVGRELYAVLGLAILTLAPMAWFGVQANMACWLFLGLALVELGRRFNFQPYLAFGFINLLLGVVWCVLKLWTDIDGDPVALQFARLGLGHATPPIPGMGYDALFSLDRFWTRLLVPAAWGICALILRQRRAGTSAWSAVGKYVAGIGGSALFLIFVSNDLNPWISHVTEIDDKRFAVGYVLGPIWSVVMATTALVGARWRRPIVSWLAIFFLFPATYLTTRLFFHNALPANGFFLNPAYFAKTVFALACVALAWSAGGKWRTDLTRIAGYLLILTQHSELRSCYGPDPNWLWSVTWSVGALAYLAIGSKRKGREDFDCFWPPILVAGYFAYLALCDNTIADAPPTPFTNPGCLSALLAAATLFLKARFSHERGAEIAVAAGWAAIAATQIELFGWFRHQGDFFAEPDIAYRWNWSAALLYNAAALIFIVLFRIHGSKELRRGAIPASLLAAAHIAALFFLRRELEPLPTPFINMFFPNASIVALSAFLIASRSDKLRIWLGILGGYLLLASAHLEIGYWQMHWLDFAGRLTRTAWYTALWSVGALAFLRAAIHCRKNRIYFTAIRALSIALFCACWQYGQWLRDPYILFLNARFLTCLLFIVTLFVLCRVSKYYERGMTESGFIIVPGIYRHIMYIVLAAAGFALLSTESFFWCLSSWSDPAAALRAAATSLSIAWGVYSVFLLIAGFATRIRGWRLGGLILFGVTCLKLAIVDLARLEQLHRILSFMVVGALLMAGSYLYHKLETRLAAAVPDREGPDGQESKAP
jgi:hypothetical protein